MKMVQAKKTKIKKAKDRCGSKGPFCSLKRVVLTFFFCEYVRNKPNKKEETIENQKLSRLEIARPILLGSFLNRSQGLDYKGSTLFA